MKAGKYQRKMEGIAAIRIRLGLTQEAFAIALGVSRSLLSKAETNTRSLPIHALKILALIEIKLDQAGKVKKALQPDSASAPKPENIQTPPIHREPDKDSSAKVSRAERGLWIMAERYQKISLNISEVDALLGETGDGDGLDPHFLTMLTLHRLCLIEKLIECSPEVQTLSGKKIALLEAREQLAETNAMLRKAFTEGREVQGTAAGFDKV